MTYEPGVRKSSDFFAQAQSAKNTSTFLHKHIQHKHKVEEARKK